MDNWSICKAHGKYCWLCHYYNYIILITSFSYFYLIYKISSSYYQATHVHDINVLQVSFHEKPQKQWFIWKYVSVDMTHLTLIVPWNTLLKRPLRNFKDIDQQFRYKYCHWWCPPIDHRVHIDILWFFFEIVKHISSALPTKRN